MVLCTGITIRVAQVDGHVLHGVKFHSRKPEFMLLCTEHAEGADKTPAHPKDRKRSRVEGCHVVFI